MEGLRPHGGQWRHPTLSLESRVKRPLIPAEGRRPLACTAFAIAALMALGHRAEAAELTGSAALTTDYVWRGSTQSDGDPAVQAGATLAGASGVYASLWGSSVRFPAAPEASTELDATVGWSRALGNGWTIDVNALRYVYAGTRGLDWNEVGATASYRDALWLSVGQSTDALALGHRGTYVQLGGRHAFNGRLRAEGGVGHYALPDAAVGGYSHAWISGVWTVRGSTQLRATLHDTDRDAKTLFGNRFAGRRVELALQTRF